MEAFAGIGNKLAYEHKEMQRFIARHGVARFAMNPHFPVNTLLVMRGAIAAEMAGVSTRYVDAVFAAMWEDGRKMDDPEVARDVLDAAGLDGVALLARTQEAGVKERLMANTKSSVQRGAFGSPTFFVGDEMFFGKDRLGDVEAALGA
jgi:2-hydroxychromene-2-carboxylate isomerase